MIQAQSAGLLRRFAAGIYDSFVMLAIIVFIGFFYVGLYKVITDSPNASAHPLLLQFVLFPLLIFACFSFYTWCWMHGGSTLGMQAWRIRLIARNGNTLTIHQCIQRCGLACLSFACFGLGYWSALWHPEKLTWHDRGSKTQVIRSVKK